MTAALSRLLLALGLIGVVVGAVVVAPVATSTPAAPAQAADLRYFDPGNIISDAVFFDGLSMDAGAIQAFLSSKASRSCPDPALDSSPCLRDFRMNTTDRAADSLCAGYRGAANESAATIIARVGASCGVSPRVLLVLLQKEMGFVTSSNPTAKMYERAAGYACPDTANGGCDPTYAGLQNQLYRSAWQYKRYAAVPGNYQYKAGRNNVIQWHPNAGCGTSTVYIANQATAGLYVYTPYRPNQAALNAGYGTGDGCSSYGNRNFWNYFTDWFGSTQSAGGAAIYAKYQQLGGSAGQMGAPTSPFICGLANGGCYQVFHGGHIYWSPATGARTSWGVVFVKFQSAGAEWGTLGYPVSDVICGLANGGCAQLFERGTVYHSPASGTSMVLGAMLEKWTWMGRETSSLGYPLTDVACGLADGGCYQVFQGGHVYWTQATGAKVSSGAVFAKFQSAGAEWGTLGYPTSDVICGLANDGCAQLFQRGTVYSSPASGTSMVLGAMLDKWTSMVRERSVLGYPVADVACGLVDGGCYQPFQGGTMYHSPSTGARYVTDPIRAKWVSTGSEWGRLGYPVIDTVCGLAAGGCGQFFERGFVYSSPGSGAHAMTGTILEKWQAAGWETSPSLGYPTTDVACGLRGNGCFQSFERGAVYSTAAQGTRLLTGPVRDRWNALGSENGPLGYALLDTMCGLVNGGCWQSFEGGSLYWTAGTGAHHIRGELRTAWQATGAEWGSLGYPLTDEICGLRDGGCAQQFERGWIYSSPDTGAHPITGAILWAWAAQNFEAGPWGYPTSKPRDVAGGVEQRFEGGTARFSTATGTVTFG